MGLNLATIKLELKELKEKKAEIEVKITALESLKGAYSSNTIKSHGSTRGIDIKPYIYQFFEKNNNQPMRKKELVEAVSEMAGLSKDVVGGKLAPIMRNKIIESSGEYGKYRLKK